MESSLLDLDGADPEVINAIFRAAHSIKGGAGTFGFTAVADFTHVVETLLDEMRNGQRENSQRLTNLLLTSVDCIRLLLDAARDGVECDDPKKLEEFKRKAADGLAIDGGGHLSYLATSRVNLSLTEERFPDINFASTREH